MDAVNHILIAMLSLVKILQSCRVPTWQLLEDLKAIVPEKSYMHQRLISQISMLQNEDATHKD